MADKIVHRQPSLIAPNGAVAPAALLGGQALVATNKDTVKVPDGLVAVASP